MNIIHSDEHLDISLFHKIDINLYPLFISIFEQRSISKAAQTLCISQSAASHALQRLRQHLADDLFSRIGRHMLPTPLAEQIYPILKNALLAIQGISFQNQKLTPNMIHSLKIAVHDEIEPMIFPKLIAHFQKLDLDIQFISSKLDRKNMMVDLATQQLDFVIDLEQKVSDKLQFDILEQDHFVVCTAQTYMDENLYLNSPHIGVSSRRTGILVEDIYLKRKQLSRQIFLRCQHYSTALQVLQQQPTAMLTLPKNILNHLQLPQGLNIFEVPVLIPTLNLGMYWYKEIKGNLRHDFLRTEIYKIFA